MTEPEKSLTQTLRGQITQVREGPHGAKYFILERDDQEALECRASRQAQDNRWLLKGADVEIVGTALPPPFEVRFGRRLDDDANSDRS